MVHAMRRRRRELCGGMAARAAHFASSYMSYVGIASSYGAMKNHAYARVIFLGVGSSIEHAF